ncbi:MAG: ABC transporter ATP-binding protein/permease [Lachnospiraceae bacterium]|nr:ABC transporter ATP-binding protein/permease [Lachnospiraceae bacterium]
MKAQVFKRILKYIGKYRGRMTLAVICGFIGTLFNIIAPSILGKITTILYAGILDHKWRKEDGVYFQRGSVVLGKVGCIVWIMLILAAIYLIAWLFAMIANSIFAQIASNVVMDLRRDIDEKMHRMKLNYYDTRTNGEILSVITNDVDAINTALGKNLYSIVTQSFTAIGVLIMMFSINGWLTLIAIAMIPATLLASGRIVKKSSENYKEQQNLLGELNGYVEEMFDGQNVVTSFNYQEKAKTNFGKINDALQGKAQKAEGLAGSVMPVTQAVNNIGYALSALVGCLFALKGTLTIGNVQSILQYTKNFSMPFTTFAQMSGQLSAAGAAGERVFALLDAEEEIPDPASGKVPEKTDGAVTFSHVQFGYVPDKLLMTDVSIDVKPGQKCAIVGPTGAGKTTLINLLMRFYEINGGNITVDGVDTKEMTRHELRKHFGMVLQDTWLFEGTIRDNLKYSTDREVTDEEIEKACASVCADTFIKTMPGGYNMMLSKGAENISQGQRQLLTIARAIIANPEIMILDEATSNVDAHTEQVIQNAMATLMKGRTSFVIAHRLSTIRDSDMILYMENGDIKEVGNHDELMKLGGKYAVLYNSQFG